MFRFSYFMLVFVLSINIAKGRHEKLIVTVFYESKCGDSRRFIKDQLYPTIQSLSPYIELRLVPFGKAHSLNNGENGFSCQHGPSECKGNMVQSCALDLMQSRSDEEKVDYVDCEMQSKAGTVGDMECVKGAGLSVSNVRRCLRGSRGIELQLEAEDHTKQFRPSFIPTITVNENFDQHIQDGALTDLEATLCSFLENAPPCSKYLLRYASSYDYYG